jgi:hypothetical protein
MRSGALTIDGIELRRIAMPLASRLGTLAAT